MPISLLDLNQLSLEIAYAEGWTLTKAELEEIYGPPELSYDAYVYHLETQDDPESQADLELHNNLWPTYYGCPTDPGYSL